MAAHHNAEQGMDLVLKVGILIVVLIVIFSGAFYIFGKGPSTTSTNINQTQAVQTVLNDVKAEHPAATVNILSVSPSPLFQNSWSIVLGMVYNGTKPCPTLLIEQFDYPATRLVNSTINVYTQGCQIYGLTNAPSYVISSPQVAIVQSYDASSAAKAYVLTYGYNATNVFATLYQVLSPSTTPLGLTGNNIWVVQYNASTAGYLQYVVLSQAGFVEGNYTVQK